MVMVMFHELESMGECGLVKKGLLFVSCFWHVFNWWFRSVYFVGSGESLFFVTLAANYLLPVLEEFSVIQPFY